MTQPTLNQDFYTHINYEWLQQNPVPSEYTRWSNFNVLHEKNQERLKEMLECEPVTEEQHKLNILWSKGMNIEELNNNNNKITDLLPENFYQQNLDELIIYWMKQNMNFFFDMESYTDLKDSNRNILYFDVMDLGLPDRDYYLNDKMKDKQDAYKEFITKYLEHFSIDLDTDYIYNLEEEVAKVRMSKADRRDPTKLYNLYKFDELKTNFPGFNWDLLFGEFKIPTNDKIVVTEPEFFKFMSNYFDKCKINSELNKKIRNFMLYKIAKVAGSFTDDKTYDLIFDFYGKTLMGQQEPKQRWKRVISFVDSVLGEVLSKVYVQKYFTEEQKVSCKNMIEEIKITYMDRLKTLDWMSDETKKKAQEKMSKFNVKIGYPDKWTDFSALKLDKNKSYLQNLFECYKWGLNHNLEKLYKPVDKLEWHMNAHDINAYYSQSMNEIVFPAGILQAPFYSPEQSLAENLGGIGAVIGHEITHGFDDKGCLYDLNGNLNDWWTAEDANKFEERSKKLEEQFNKYQYFGLNVNGKLTLGENIADLGGLTFSLKTLERLVSSNLADEKRKLFEQWAKVWRCNIKEDSLKNQLLTDPHSPTQLRVNGILPNIDDFYEIFDIQETDAMYLKPELRSKIW
jgi:putative endopeptidase